MKEIVQFDHPRGKQPVVLKNGQVVVWGEQEIAGQSDHKSKSNSVPECESVKNNKDASGQRPASSVGIGDIRQDVIHAENGVFILDENCVIQHCNGKGSELFGFNPKSLISHPVAKVLPHLADMPLICNEEINPRLRFLSRAGHYFEAVGNDGVHFKCGLIFNLKKYQDRDYVQLIICPIPSDIKRIQ
ncbi:MAG: hypothetical protein KGZ88_18060 [Methylomicrobium sp.]|nr:hypothetical protein [Methylomicrobium sp.]